MFEIHPLVVEATDLLDQWETLVMQEFTGHKSIEAGFRYDPAPDGGKELSLVARFVGNWGEILLSPLDLQVQGVEPGIILAYVKHFVR